MENEVLFFFRMCDNIENLSGKLEGIEFRNNVSKFNLDIFHNLDEDSKMLFLFKMYTSNKNMYERFVKEYSKFLSVK